MAPDAPSARRDTLYLPLSCIEELGYGETSARIVFLTAVGCRRHGVGGLVWVLREMIVTGLQRGVTMHTTFVGQCERDGVSFEQNMSVRKTHNTRIRIYSRRKQTVQRYCLAGFHRTCTEVLSGLPGT